MGFTKHLSLALILEFFFPAWVSFIPAALGVGNALFGGGGGGSGGGQGSAGYAPSGLGNADQMWQQLAGVNNQSLQGLAGQINPAFQQSFQQGMGINYNPYLQASQQAGNEYGGLANMAGQYGGMMQQQAQGNFGQQQNLQGMGNQLWQQAADPQNDLYNRSRQQLMDQTGAVNSMYGLGSSGAGAGMADQALSNFNIDWQNNQLQRMLQAGQGAAGLSKAGGMAGTLGSADLQSGMGYYGQQPGFQQQSAQVPLNAQQYAAAQPGQLGATYASQVGQGMAPYNQQQNQIVPYLFQGAGATGNAYANQLAGQQQQSNNLQNLGNTLGQVNWGQLGSMFSQPNQSINDPFGAAGGLGGAMTAGDYSDRRLKTNVVRVGTHRLGIGVYQYDIFGRREQGVMADEVAAVLPEAVTVGPDGFMRVRYGMLEG